MWQLIDHPVYVVLECMRKNLDEFSYAFERSNVNHDLHAYERCAWDVWSQLSSIVEGAREIMEDYRTVVNTLFLCDVNPYSRADNGMTRWKRELERIHRTVCTLETLKIWLHKAFILSGNCGVTELTKID